MYDPQTLASWLKLVPNPEPNLSRIWIGSESEELFPPKRMKSVNQKFYTLAITFCFAIYERRNMLFESELKLSSRRKSEKNNWHGSSWLPRRKLSKIFASTEKWKRNLRQVRPKYWFDKFCLFPWGIRYCRSRRRSSDILSSFQRQWFFRIPRHWRLLVVVKNPYSMVASPPYTLMQAW